jgi:hypothetical protein
MNVLEELQAEFADIQPILILAPTTRCGSTLLQRAINERAQAIIYGENFIFLESAPIMVSSDVETINGKIRATAATLARFLGGEKGMDASALFPDYGAYRRLLWESFFRLAAFYRDRSRQYGYERWGLKHQITNLAGFHRFLQLIPRYASVTLYRDLVAVARSMQSRWPENLKTEAQCFAIGKRWRQNLQYLMKLEPGRNLVVRYEDLAADSEPCIARIEAHLGLALSRAAFAKKVNAHTFDPASGRAGEIYRAPTELPTSKIRALLDGAGPLYGELGYSYQAVNA